VGTQNSNKLNRLILSWPKGTVCTSTWLAGQGIGRNLINKYKRSGWVAPIGNGAYILSRDNIQWPGAVYAIQKQLKLDLHVGGKTALQLKGVAHYLPVDIKKVYLFGGAGEKLPSWFKSYNWGIEVDYSMTKLFQTQLGFVEEDYGSFSLEISSPERAILEVLYLVPHKQTFEESSLLMENLITLRPVVVRQLLEGCNSIKVKRLFMFLAEKHGHAWIDKLDLSAINLGNGKRVIVKGGMLDKKYQITVPK
jgi:hypothetical protein